MQIANPTSCIDAFALYKANVQNWLSLNRQPSCLTETELRTVHASFDAGERTDLCAALIRTDRFLQGAGRSTSTGDNT